MGSIWSLNYRLRDVTGVGVIQIFFYERSLTIFISKTGTKFFHRCVQLLKISLRRYAIIFFRTLQICSLCKLLCKKNHCLALWYFMYIPWFKKRCEFESLSWRGVLYTTLCDKMYLWLKAGRWFSPSTSFSSTNKTDRYDITQSN